MLVSMIKRCESLKTCEEQRTVVLKCEIESSDGRNIQVLTPFSVN